MADSFFEKLYAIKDESGRIPQEVLGKLNENFRILEMLLQGYLGTDNIQDGTVTEDKLGDDSVTAAKIPDLTIASEHLAAAAVTIGKIANAAVDANALADLAVTQAKLAEGSVSSTKLATGVGVPILSSLPSLPNANYPIGCAITLSTDSKLYRNQGNVWTCATATGDLSGQITTTQITDDAVTTAKIAANAITATEIAADAVIAAKIAAGAIEATKIAAGAVGATALAANSVAAVNIQADAVTSDKIYVQNLAAISEDVGTITAGTISTDVLIYNRTSGALNDFVDGFGDGHMGSFNSTGNVTLGSSTTYTSKADFDAMTLSGIDTATSSGNALLSLITPAFTRATVAYDYSGTQVTSGNARYGTGAFSNGIIIEEGTSNLLTENQSSVETDTTGFNVNNTGSTLTRDTSEHWTGSACLKIVTTGALNNQGANAVISPGLSVGTTYTFSVYLKGSGTVSIGLGGSAWTDVTLTSTWTRYTVTRTLTAGDLSRIYIINRTTTAVSACYADGLQVEAKAYATAWQIGGTARNAETLTIPTSGAFSKSAWTIEMVIKLTNVTAGTLWQCYTDNNNFYSLEITASNYIQLRIISGGTGYTITGNVALTAGTLYYIMACGDGTHIRLCRNGSQVGSDTDYVEPVGSLPTNMYIGSNYAGSGQINGIVDDLRISNTARTLDAHQAYYNGGSPHAVDTNTTYLAAFNSSIPSCYQRTGTIITGALDNVTSLGIYATHTSTTPSNTSVTIEYSQGTNGVVWGDWTAMTNAAKAGTQAKVRFRLTLATTDLVSTPTVASLKVDANLGYSLTDDASTIILQFNNFTLNAGHTLTVSNRVKGLFIFARGNCTIAGTINMNGKAAKISTAISQQRFLQVPVGAILVDAPPGGAGGNGGAGGAGGAYGGASGGNGGAGRTGTNGVWFGGGMGAPAGGGGSGALSRGVVLPGKNGSDAGTADLLTAIGAVAGANFCGGNGALDDGLNSECGGGGAGVVGGTGPYAATDGGAATPAGGGLVVLVVKGSLNLSGGTISCNGIAGAAGGNGCTSGTYGGGGGGGGQGGGGGGAIVLAYRGTYTAGTPTVDGGTAGSAGAKAGSGANGAAGTAGSVGTIIAVQV